MGIESRMVVTAVVKARSEEEDGWKLELDVPQFRSKYPTKVSYVKEAVAKLLPPRAEPYSVVLVRENLMKDKSGDLPWHYYWGLEGLATAQEQAAKAAVPDHLDEREHRIMRSTALAQAVALEVAYLQRPGTGVAKDLTGLLHVAEQFYAWLRNGPAQAPVATPSPAKATAPAVRRSAAAKTSAAKPSASDDYETRLRAFLDKAQADLGMDFVAANSVAKAQGIDLNNPATDLRALWEKLKAAKA